MGKLIGDQVMNFGDLSSGVPGSRTLGSGTGTSADPSSRSAHGDAGHSTAALKIYSRAIPSPFAPGGFFVPPEVEAPAPAPPSETPPAPLPSESCDGRDLGFFPVIFSSKTGELYYGGDKDLYAKNRLKHIDLQLAGSWHPQSLEQKVRRAWDMVGEVELAIMYWRDLRGECDNVLLFGDFVSKVTSLVSDERAWPLIKKGVDVKDAYNCLKPRQVNASADLKQKCFVFTLVNVPMAIT